MGGADFYCSVSGARYFNSTDEFFSDLLYDENTFNDSENSYDRDDFSHGIQRFEKHLHYSEEDVESSRRFVLFCPCEILEGGTMIKYIAFDDPHPSEYTESTITEVFDIIPGENPEYGDYIDIDEQSYSVLPCGNCLIVTYTSYLILKQAAPDIKPHILYALAYGGNRETMGEVAGIDYGPVGRIIDQYAFWPGICEGGSEFPVTFWRRLFSDKERAEEDILHDAWKGPGNMWVFVRPDRFPIAETLAANPPPNFPCPINTEPTCPTFQGSRPTLTSLPPDIILSTCEFLPIRSIYALITTCKKFRSIILPHANAIARRRLIAEEPWYLPAGPFELNPTTPATLKRRREEKPWRKEMNGREEIEWWTEQWAAGGILPEEMDAKIPWFVYRKECSKSMSMWNRKRIWGISKQLDTLARVKGLL